MKSLPIMANFSVLVIHSVGSLLGLLDNSSNKGVKVRQKIEGYKSYFISTLSKLWESKSCNVYENNELLATGTT